MSGKNKYIVFILLVFSQLLSCHTEDQVDLNEAEEAPVNTLPYYDTPDFNPIWSPEEFENLHQIKAFDFLDQNGNNVTKTTFENKIYLANFFFTSCGSICPKMIRNMEYVQNELREDNDVMFISHSVLPEIDSVAKLKTYTQNFEVDDERWKFVTGNKSEIYELARKSYFAEEDIGFNKDSTEFLHTEHFILVDQDFHIRGIYNGTIKLEMDRIIEDILMLKTEG